MTTVAIQREDRGAARLGITDMLPAALGVVPFAMMIGVAIADSRISSTVGFLGGIMVAGGSAHLAVVASLQAATGVLASVATALMIQMRGMAYSATLAPSFRSQPRWFRWAASYILVDQLFALAIAVVDRPHEWFRRYYLAAGALLFGSYTTGILVGLLAGPVIPAGSPVSMAIPLMFAAMLAPAITSRPSAGAAVTAGSSVVVLSPLLPSGVGLLAAMILGAAAGAMMERRSG